MTLQDTIFFIVILLPFIGAVIGGILGYRKAKKRNKLIMTLFYGFIGILIAIILMFIIYYITGSGSFGGIIS